MRDLEDGPERFLPLLALVRRGFGVLHLVGKLEQGVFDILEAVRWGLAIATACASNGRHLFVMSALVTVFPCKIRGCNGLTTVSK